MFTRQINFYIIIDIVNSFIVQNFATAPRNSMMENSRKLHLSNLVPQIESQQFREKSYLSKFSIDMATLI